MLSLSICFEYLCYISLSSLAPCCSLLPFCYLLALLWRSPMHTYLCILVYVLSQKQNCQHKGDPVSSCHWCRVVSGKLLSFTLSLVVLSTCFPFLHNLQKASLQFQFCFSGSFGVYPRLTLNSVSHLLYPPQCLVCRCVPPSLSLNRTLLMF